MTTGAAVSPEGEIRALLASSRNLAAAEAARAAWQASPGTARLGYLYALASARAGAAAVARQALRDLRAEPVAEPDLAAEIASLAGRLAKDEAAAAGDVSLRDLRLREAIAAYRRADALKPNAYARINTASLLLLAGEAAAARELARSVLKGLDAQASAEDHWTHATRGEALLLLGRDGEAAARYRDARAAAGDRHGDTASMRRQLALLAERLPGARVALQELPGPLVLAFSGHMIDAPARASPRFPAALEPAVREAIEGYLRPRLPAIGYSQAACGADLIFCEAMLALGQEVNVLLPFAKVDYLEQSVAFAGEGWVRRFEEVLSRAASVTYATGERHLGDDTLFEHASSLIQGMAFLRARELAIAPRMLAVLDLSQAGGVGGTQSTREAWADERAASDTLDLGEIRRHARLPASAGAAAASAGRAATETQAPAGRVIRALLFADIKGFSRLPEEYAPAFFTTFLGLVPATLAQVAVRPLEISTRGDGLYAVFSSAEDAAAFALRLSAAVGAIDWQGMGLPAETHLRVALHAGPVFVATDPVTGLLAHYGTHVTRAARVEPVVIPGQVLVTEPFAALLASRPASTVACDFIGMESLAKGYGEARLYRLRER
jgi:tetratricopeptide (TPR) repeat protein